MSGPALYFIAEAYRADLAALDELNFDAQTIADTLDGMRGELQDKLRAVIAWGLDQSVLAAGTHDAAKRMAELAASRQKRADAVFAYALHHMQGTGINEIATDEWQAKVAKKPASVQIAASATIPPEYLRTLPAPEPQPDKAALKAALAAGAVIDGVTLVSGYRLAVR